MKKMHMDNCVPRDVRGYIVGFMDSLDPVNCKIQGGAAWKNKCQ